MALTIILFGIGWTIEKDIYAQSDKIGLTILLGTHPNKIIIKAHTAEKVLKHRWFKMTDDVPGKLEKSDSPEVSYVLPSKGEIERSKEREVTVSLMVINVKEEKQGTNITFDVSEWFVKKDCQNVRNDLEETERLLSSGDLKEGGLNEIKIRLNRLREKECPDSNAEELLEIVAGMQACQGDVAQLESIRENLKSLGNTDGLRSLREIETHQESLRRRKGELDALSSKECVKNLVDDELRKLNELSSCLNDMAESEKIKEVLVTLKESESSGDLKSAEVRLRDLNALEKRLRAALDKRCSTGLNETENLLKELKIRLLYEKKRKELEARLEKLKNKFRKMRGDAEKLNKLKEFRQAEERLKELKSITEQFNAVNDSDSLKNIEKELGKFGLSKPTVTSSTTTSSSVTSTTSDVTSSTTTSSPATTTTVDYIRQQLKKANELFKKKQYTTPQRNNAFAIYKKILRSEPANPHARKKIRKMMQDYKKWGDNAYNQGKYDRSGTHYRKYLKIAEYVMDNFGSNSIRKEIGKVRKRMERPVTTSTTSSVISIPATTSTIPVKTSSTPVTSTIRSERSRQLRQSVLRYIEKYKRLKHDSVAGNELIQTIKSMLINLKRIEQEFPSEYSKISIRINQKHLGLDLELSKLNQSFFKSRDEYIRLKKIKPKPVNQLITVTQQIVRILKAMEPLYRQYPQTSEIKGIIYENEDIRDEMEKELLILQKK